MVDGRSREVTEQTIKSLQKIETSVERLSSDTQGLIKAGWDRMLGSAIGDGTHRLVSDDTNDIKAIASGITAELRSDLLANAEGRSEKPEPGAKGGSPDVATIEAALDELQSTLESMRSVVAPSPSRVSSVDRWVDVLGSLDPVSFEIAKALSLFGAHLERPQYASLSSNPNTQHAVEKLRTVGLLVPLSPGRERAAPVYWFPPGVSKDVRVAIILMDREDSDAHGVATEALVQARYLKREDGHFVLDERARDEMRTAAERSRVRGQARVEAMLRERAEPEASPGAVS